LSTGLSSANASIVTLSTSTSTAFTSLATVVSTLENSFRENYIVPLNTSTINGLTAPITQTYPYDVICPVDGWYWDNNINDNYIDTRNNTINWTIYPKNDQYSSQQINPYVNRIYFNCYLYKLDATNVSTIPTLFLKLSGTTFTGTINFTYTATPLTTAGLYTFVADIGSSTANFGTIYNNGGVIKKLTFGTSNPSGQTLSSVNVTTESIDQIYIATSSTTTVKYKFILSSIFLETNNGTNAFGGATNTGSYIGAGVVNYCFSSGSVKELYYERSLTYLYSQFYNKPIAKVVSPFFNGGVLSPNPLINGVVPTPTL
jgi:hypothetical protein